MRSPRSTSLLASAIAISSALAIVGARVHWGFGDDMLSLPVLAWLIACSSSSVLLARSRKPSRRHFSLLLATSTMGGYLVGGYPEYFHRGVFAVSSSIAWVILLLMLTIGCAFIYLIATRVAEFALDEEVPSANHRKARRPLLSAAGLALTFAIGELVVTRAFAAASPLKYWSDAPSTIPPLAGSGMVQALAGGVALVAAVAAGFATRQTTLTRR